MAGSSANPPRIANPPRMVVGISGASGSVYGLRLLELLRGSGAAYLSLETGEFAFSARRGGGRDAA